MTFHSTKIQATFLIFTATELPLSPTTAAYTMPSAPVNVAAVPTSDHLKGASNY